MKKQLVFIGQIATVILFLVAGIGIFFIIGKSKHENMIYLGAILMLMGIIEGLLYYSTEKKTLVYCHDVIVAIFEFAIGIAFIIYNEGDVLTLNSACVIWGILEIIKSILEARQIVYECRNIKFYVIVDMVLTSICLVFGILLCVHAEHGIKLHLYITAASLLVWSLTYIFRFFIFKQKEIKHEEN